MCKVTSKAKKPAHANGKEVFFAKAKLFQQVLNEVSSPTFDDFTLQLTGTVNDVNKFHEVEEKFPYGKISFVKNRGNKKKVLVELRRNYKDMEDALLDEVRSDAEIEEEIYEQMRGDGYFD